MANIFKEAKKIQRAHPRMNWQQAIQKASKQHKKVGTAKKVSAVKFIERGEKRSTPSKKIYRVARSKDGTYKGAKRVNGVTGTKHSVKKVIEQKLGKACLDYELATTIKATKEAQSRKVKYRKLLRSI